MRFRSYSINSDHFGLEEPGMKKCPFCAEMIQGEASKCRFCGELLDAPVSAPQDGPPPAMPPEKMAEIRRLQRIASGRPTRADKSLRTKGLIYLGIIVLILMYSWHWRKTQQISENGTPAKRTEISLEAFTTVFGPGSPLSATSKNEEFENFRGKVVSWSGVVVYVNNGDGAKAFVTVRETGAGGPANVTIFLKKSERSSLDELRVGQKIDFSGRISGYGQESDFITLISGVITDVD